MNGLDELAAAGVVALLAGLDEVVVGDLQGGPDFLELAGHVVDVGFGLEAELPGAERHLVGVFIVAHQEMDLATFHPAEPGLNVGPDLLERRADVRAAVGIVNRGRDVKLIRFGHRVVPVLDPGSPTLPRAVVLPACPEGGRDTDTDEPEAVRFASLQESSVYQTRNLTRQQRTRLADGETLPVAALDSRDQGVDCQRSRDCAIRRRHQRPQPSMPTPRIRELGSGTAGGDTVWARGLTSGAEFVTDGAVKLCGDTAVCGTGV